MPDKKCPNCGLWNSEKAELCDCGYNFITGNITDESTIKENIILDFDKQMDIISRIAQLILGIATTIYFLSIYGAIFKKYEYLIVIALCIIWFIMTLVNKIIQKGINSINYSSTPTSIIERIIMGFGHIVQYHPRLYKSVIELLLAIIIPATSIYFTVFFHSMVIK